MRTLGLLGGMSWQSTAVYYRLLNEGVAQRRGGLHSAALVMASVDFEAIAALQRVGDWPATANTLARAAQGLKAAGAQALVIATNTMHIVAEMIERACGLPLLHIADATAHALRADGHRRIGLLGTRFTMEQPFYREHLLQRHGVETLVPGDEDRALVHRVIFDELCRGIVSDASRDACRGVIERLRNDGATAVVLGCTELVLLLPAGSTLALPAYDTTALHAQQALDWMLA
jgi:aspartate racemase